MQLEDQTAMDMAPSAMILASLAVTE